MVLNRQLNSDAMFLGCESTLPPVCPVSVIVPCFNNAETIRRALDSVAGQTLMPREIIIVDDHSQDATVSVVRQWASQFERCRVHVIVLDVNRGAASARNAGWAVASEPLVAFLDADDYWLPNKLEYQHGFMSTHVEISLCGHGHLIEGAAVAIESVTATTIIPAWGLLLSNPMVTPSVMLRRDIPFRFMEGRRYMEDHLLWMEVALSGLMVARLGASLAVIGKPAFGAGGLSAQMWRMEKGDLQNYWYLHRTGRLGLAATLFFSCYSVAKYARRLLIIGFRSTFGSMRRECT